MEDERDLVDWWIDWLQRCADMSTGNALLLNSIMSSFRASFVAVRAVDLARRIRDMADDSTFPRHLLYCSLGLCVAAADPPDDQKLVLLNEVLSFYSFHYVVALAVSDV